MFSRAHLRNSDFFSCTFKDVTFTQANLTGATILSDEQSEKFALGGANLSKSHLRGSFKNSTFENADLSDAKLDEIDLSNSNLKGTDLTNTKFISYINLSNVRYEPIAAPNVISLGELNLNDIWYSKNKQTGLIKLRSSLKDAGLRDLEREVTYYLNFLT